MEHLLADLQHTCSDIPAAVASTDKDSATAEIDLQARMDEFRREQADSKRRVEEEAAEVTRKREREAGDLFCLLTAKNPRGWSGVHHRSLTSHLSKSPWGQSILKAPGFFSDELFKGFTTEADGTLGEAEFGRLFANEFRDRIDAFAPPRPVPCERPAAESQTTRESSAAAVSVQDPKACLFEQIKRRAAVTEACEVFEEVPGRVAVNLAWAAMKKNREEDRQAAERAVAELAAVEKAMADAMAEEAALQAQAHQDRLAAEEASRKAAEAEAEARRVEEAAKAERTRNAAELRLEIEAWAGKIFESDGSAVREVQLDARFGELAKVATLCSLSLSLSLSGRCDMLSPTVMMPLNVR